MLRRSSLVVGRWGGFGAAFGGNGKARVTFGEEEAKEQEGEAGEGEGGEQEQKRKYDHFDPNDPGNMPLQEYMKITEAYQLFGFGLTEEVTADEVKKRFKKLALKAHPDSGGSSDDFKKLIDAHKIMQSVRHDRATKTKSGKKTNIKVNFTRESFDSMTNTPHRESAEEITKVDRTDLICFALACTAVFGWYIYYKYERSVRLVRSRGRLKDEHMFEQDEPKPNQETHQWHAWRTTDTERQALKWIEQTYLTHETQKEREALGVKGISAFSPQRAKGFRPEEDVIAAPPTGIPGACAG